MTRSRPTPLLLLITLLTLVAGCATLDQMKDGTFTLENVKLPDFSRSNNPSANASSGEKSASGGSAGYMRANFQPHEVPHVLLTKPVAEGRLTSTFGYRLNPTAKFIKLPKRHKGIDYAADAGTPIYASGDGVVDRKYVSGSYGNFLRIKHANDFQSVYAHMQNYAGGIEEGSVVKKGQIIGVVGTTGQSTSPHLHYELLYQGKHVDPLFAGR